MDNKGTGRFDNLSNLEPALRQIELQHLPPECPDLAQARNGLLGGIRNYMQNRYNFGRLLRIYKTLYKKEHGWTAAAKVIAAAIGREERTIYRLIEDYERAENLTPILVDAMVEQKIDPAARKNATLVTNLLQVPAPQTRAEADAVVATAMREQVAEKKARKGPKPVLRAKELKALARNIVEECRHHFRNAGQEERKAELRYVFGEVVAALGLSMEEFPPAKPAERRIPDSLNDAA